MIPGFDMLRVFSIRIINAKNPFKADRLHLHHLLIDNGFNSTENTAGVDEVGIVENYTNDSYDNSSDNFLDDYSGGSVQKKHIKKYKTPITVEEAFFNRS